MLSHTTLAAHYENMFALAQHHNYSFDEMEKMIPFERYIYLDMLIEFLKEQKEEAERNGRR